MISNLRHVCCIEKSNFQPKYSIGIVSLAFIAPFQDLLLFRPEIMTVSHFLFQLQMISANHAHLFQQNFPPRSFTYDLYKACTGWFSRIALTRTELIPWTLNLYPASRGFCLARFMCGVVRVAIIRVVGLLTPPNRNADGNFSVVEMRRLKAVQSNFYLIGERGIQLQIFAQSKRHVFQHLLIS